MQALLGWKPVMSASVSSASVLMACVIVEHADLYPPTLHEHSPSNATLFSAARGSLPRCQVLSEDAPQGSQSCRIFSPARGRGCTRHAAAPTHMLTAFRPEGCVRSKKKSFERRRAAAAETRARAARRKKSHASAYLRALAACFAKVRPQIFKSKIGKRL